MTRKRKYLKIKVSETKSEEIPIEKITGIQYDAFSTEEYSLVVGTGKKPKFKHVLDSVEGTIDKLKQAKE